MKEKLLSIIFILIIGIHFLLGIIIPDREISFSERRKLTQRPNINIGDIVSGSYMDRLNDYLLDQIVFRDNYMDIYGWFSRNIYRENVVNDIYIFDDYMYKIDGNTRYDSVDNIINKINDMSSYFDTDRIYYSIIPDKNYYFDLEWIPKVDYNYIVDTFNNKIKYKYIDNISYAYIIKDGQEVLDLYFQVFGIILYHLLLILLQLHMLFLLLLRIWQAYK